MKILSIGNSFSVDTMKHLADILKDLGVTNFKLGNLFIPGCSINKHYYNITNDITDYSYYTNTGDEWVKTEQVSSRTAVLAEDWDIICIHHGTKDKSRYTSPESYENLPALIGCVKSLAGENTKIAFNMAWVAEPESTHHEITSYSGDQLLMYEKLTALTENLVKPLVDAVNPVGTAIQNVRPYISRKLTRDDFHLSYDLGRYIAGLTFVKALCCYDVEGVQWCPEGVTEQEQKLAKKAVNKAIAQPYQISEL